MRFALHSMLLAALALAAALTQAQGSPEDIARQWCANCHNADGNSTSPLFPRLAGQQPAYLVAQLHALRNKSRSDHSAHDYMWGIASTLDDHAIEGIAQYFAAQTPQPNPGKVDAELAKAGEQLFHNGNASAGIPPCAACHGENGHGTEMAPRLAGQHAAYVEKQLHVFETSQRPSAVAMQAIVKALRPADIQALAAYVQTLK